MRPLAITFWQYVQIWQHIQHNVKNTCHEYDIDIDLWLIRWGIAKW